MRLVPSRLISWLGIRLPSACSAAAKLGDDAGDALGAEADGDAVDIDVDALDQQLDDARLLGREEFVPESIELDERVAHLGLADVAVVFARCRPGLHDHLGRAQQDANLVDDGSLDLAGRQPSDRAGFRSELLHAGGDVVAVEPALLARVGRRHGIAVRREDQAAAAMPVSARGSALPACAGSRQ